MGCLLFLCLYLYSPHTFWGHGHNTEVFGALFRHENKKELRDGRIQITDSTGLLCVRQIENWKLDYK
jgi:hypothetical protein